MLPAANRLRRGAEFRAVGRTGSRAGGPRIVISAAISPTDGHGGGHVRVGFSVGRAVGNAVVRNTVRRKLRHLMRERLGALPSASRVVIRALPAAAQASSAVLGSDLDRALARVVDKAGVAV